MNINDRIRALDVALVLTLVGGPATVVGLRYLWVGVLGVVCLVTAVGLAWWANRSGAK